MEKLKTYLKHLYALKKGFDFKLVLHFLKAYSLYDERQICQQVHVEAGLRYVQDYRTEALLMTG